MASPPLGAYEGTPPCVTLPGLTRRPAAVDSMALPVSQADLQRYPEFANLLSELGAGYCMPAPLPDIPPCSAAAGQALHQARPRATRCPRAPFIIRSYRRWAP
jgi:hypothetical protein